ncbi:MAG: hypothetical protein D6725_12925 [Planctomycetota bacterium]|nr:MAG: hypothetical protein D6725_12925 [Planctomycetota bacterium]
MVVGSRPRWLFGGRLRRCRAAPWNDLGEGERHGGPRGKRPTGFASFSWAVGRGDDASVCPAIVRRTTDDAAPSTPARRCGPADFRSKRPPADGRSDGEPDTC